MPSLLASSAEEEGELANVHSFYWVSIINWQYWEFGARQQRSWVYGA